MKSGLIGETLAAEYLLSKNYTIVQRNFYLRGGEIDIVALYEKVLIFIEVKTRTSLIFGEGIESISGRKALCLRRAQHGFLQKNPARFHYKNTRWDVIDLVINTKRRKILAFTHYKNVHLPHRVYYSNKDGTDSE